MRADRLRPLSIALALLCCAAVSAAKSAPTLLALRGATVSTPDLEYSATAWSEYLEYQTMEAGVVSAAQAESWGAPVAAGAAYRLLAPGSGDGPFLRLVANGRASAFRPLHHSGWSALEYLVEDPDAVHHRLQDSPFTHLGGPDFLAAGSSIRAVQYLGPALEVLYFTADTGPAESSTLARARSPVDRLFIAVLATDDMDRALAFYRQQFNLAPAYEGRFPIPFLAAAQGLPATESFPLALLRLRSFSHSVEIDAYPAAPIPPGTDHGLPGGIAIVSFAVDALPASTELPATGPRGRFSGRAYDGASALTLRGSAGERIELISAVDCADASQRPKDISLCQ